MTPSLFTQRLQAWLALATWAWMLGTARLWFVVERPEPIPLLLPLPILAHLAMAACLAGAATLLGFRPRHRRATLVIAALLPILMLADHNRIQPISLLLAVAAFSLFHARKRDGRAGDRFANQALRTTLAGAYLWLAVAGLEPSFWSHGLPQMLRQLGQLRPGPISAGLLALPLIVLPAAAAVALLRGHPWALRLAIATHLSALGLGGTIDDPAAWSFHIITGSLLGLLFYRPPDGAGLWQQIRRRRIHQAVLVCAMLGALMQLIGLFRLGTQGDQLGAGFVATQSPAQGWLTARPNRRQDALLDAFGLSSMTIVDEERTVRRLFGVKGTVDGLALRRRHRLACASGEAFRLSIRRPSRWSGARAIVLTACDGSERSAQAPAFLR